MAELFTFALGRKVVVEPDDSERLIGDGGRGELVREGGLEDVEGALYVTLTVT